MSGPQILYGVRNGELVHIDDVDRGQACNCTCYECGRPLVARKGEILTHFFAHEASEVNCNPTPESLIHRYAKQQIAKMGRLSLPGFSVVGRHQTPDGAVHSLHWRYLPTYSVDIQRAEVESRQHAGVVPDVLILGADGFYLLVEVFYRHAVEADKLEKLIRLNRPAVEVDLSDLAVSAPSTVINEALRQVRRWTWLNNVYQSVHQHRLITLLEAAFRPIKIQPPLKHPITSNSTIPSRMIADASSPAIAAKTTQLVGRLRAASSVERPALLHTLSREMRLALHCHQIGISPSQLPSHLMQAVTRQSVYGSVPVILWQTGVFAKFCMTGGPVGAQQAAHWIRTVFPGMHNDSALYCGANNLNEYSEATFNFLNHLAEQGLLERIPAKRPWDTRFKPVAPTFAEVRDRLLELRPAARRRPD